MASTPNPAAKLQHVRPVRPLTFPVSEAPAEHLGQSLRHWELCALLGWLLRSVTAPEHAYGADQFVYWNPRQPRRCLAPDGFVKLGVPFELVDSWKTWERGVPELAVEILSPSDTPERWALSEKLERYHEVGVRELVCFDLDGRASPGDSARMRVWDLVDGDLVERVIEDERTVCFTLSAPKVAPTFEWTIGEAGDHPAALRLLRDGVLVPLDLERLLEAERERAEANASATPPVRASPSSKPSCAREGSLTSPPPGSCRSRLVPVETASPPMTANSRPASRSRRAAASSSARRSVTDRLGAVGLRHRPTLRPDAREARPRAFFQVCLAEIGVAPTETRASSVEPRARVRRRSGTPEGRRRTRARARRRPRVVRGAEAKPQKLSGATISRMTAKPTPPAQAVPLFPESKIPWVECTAEDAPYDDIPETDEERRMVAEARESRARGERTYTSEEVKAVIEEMRRKQEGG